MATEEFGNYTYASCKGFSVRTIETGVIATVRFPPRATREKDPYVADVRPRTMINARIIVARAYMACKFASCEIPLMSTSFPKRREEIIIR